MELKSIGHGKYEATNGVDTVIAVYKRSAPRQNQPSMWELTLNDKQIFVVHGNKDTAMGKTEDLLVKPGKKLDYEAAVEMQKKFGEVFGIIRVSMSDILRRNIDEFNDFVESKLVTSDCMLTNICFHPVGTDVHGDIFMRISGEIFDEEI